MNLAPPRTVGARWRPVSGSGLEQVDLAPEGDEIVARGVIVGSFAGVPFGLDFTIACDRAFRVRSFDLGTTRGMALSMRADGEGRWLNYDGRPLPEFDGCIDVDLAGSAFTNTLPIRRIELARLTGPVPIRTVVVPFDTFVPTTDGQVSTALDGGRRFLYEAADGSFSAELPVDEDGLVVDYPGWFRRETEW